MHVVATAGHVDHGKSTLVRLLTGMEPDRWAEERRRGMTIDLGYAWTTLPSGEQVAFVDVPGHERFVTNMLAGVGPVPAVMLVVAADEGWRAQTDEHVEILRALGVEHLLLVVSRADLADPLVAAADAARRLADRGLHPVAAVHTAATTGAGLDELRHALGQLVARLDQPDSERPARLWIDRAFTIRGAGTVVTGTLAGGTLRIGDAVTIAPTGFRGTVRALQSCKQEVSEATAVARVAVNLRGVDVDQLARGQLLVTGTGWLRVTTADVRLSHAFATEHATLHIGAASVPVRVRVIGLDGRHARLQLAQAAPLEIGDRGLLRDPSSRAVAGVAVLDVEPPAFMRRGEPVHRAQQLERVPELTTADDLVAWRGVIASEGLAAMGLETATSAKQVGDYVIAPERWRQWTTALTQLLMVDPAGVSEGEVVTQLGLPDRQLLPELCDAADAVTNRGRVRRRGAPDVELPDEINAVERRLRANPFDALDLATLQALGLDRKALGAAVAAQRLVRIAPDIYLLPDAPTQAVRRLRELPDEFTVSEARQALDSTRRVVVPLLEHLDATGRTRRVDATRRRLVHNAGQDEEDIGTA